MEKTIGQKLVELRRNKGLSQQQIAEILNVSRQTISKWESDLSLPDIEVLLKLCDYYEISINELLSIKEESEDVKSIYEQLQQVLKNLQKENKQKNIFNIVLICISVFSLSVSLFMGSMNNKLLNDKSEDLINEGFILANKNSYYDKIFENKNKYDFIKSYMTEIKIADIIEKTITVDYRFELKEYNQNTNVQIEFLYTNLENGSDEVKIFDLKQVRENEFKFNQKIPLTDYQEVNLLIDDGIGNKKIERLLPGDFFYKQIILKDYINFYVPRNNGELDREKIIYVPTLFHDGDSNISKELHYVMKEFEGGINVQIFNPISHDVYFDGDIDINQRTEIKLKRELPENEFIVINVKLNKENEEYFYSKMFNLSLDYNDYFNWKNRAFNIETSF